MVLKQNEYKIDDNGIWISKKALERNRDTFFEIAMEHKGGAAKGNIDNAYYYHFHGKADALIEILKMFNQEIFY